MNTNGTGDAECAAYLAAHGDAMRAELAAARGGDDLCGECATCSRMGAATKG